MQLRGIHYDVGIDTLAGGLTRPTLSGTAVPRVALPRTTDAGELVRYLRSENLPGYFPFTAALTAALPATFRSRSSTTSLYAT